MKTVFITIGDGEVSKNILGSEIFPLVQKENKIVLFVQPNKLDYFRKKLSLPNVQIEVLPKPTHAFLEEIFSDIFLFSLHSQSILVKIDHSYYSGGTLIGRLAKLLLWSLGSFYAYRQLIRFLYKCVPDRSFFEHFYHYKPDLVFAANLISNEDSRMLKTAQSFRVKSVGMPKGWDNLTLKTFLGVFPDSLLVQNELIKKDAINFLDYPEDKIRVVGFPKFDAYIGQPRVTREEFLLSVGLDPNKKTILYAGAGDQLAPHDEEVLRDLLRSIEDGVINVPVQVLVRPHPKYLYRSEIIRPSSLWVLDRPGKMVGIKQSDFEFESDDVSHLMNSLVYCDLLIHTASTLGIEAAIFDKPSISIAFDGDTVVRPELSVARYYRYVHMERVLNTAGMKIAYSFKELLDFVGAFLEHPELDRSERRLMKEENCYIIDGFAGKRVGDYLAHLLSGIL